MATPRVNITTGAPSTNFITEADMVSQNQSANLSTLYYYVQAINRGGTGSYSNYAGSQTATIAGAGGSGHSGTLPAGVGTNVQRWYEGPWALDVGHDSAGNRGVDTVTQRIRGWFGSTSYARDDSGTIGPYPRIPKRPSPPGTPTASNLLPTSLTVSWGASSDAAGSTINAYLLRRWSGSSFSGAYVDNSGTSRSRSVTGLTPGATYSFGVYAHNGSADNNGYSNVSGKLTVTMLAPMHFKVSGTWEYAIPYLKVSGAWKMTQPYVKSGGTWHTTG